MTPPLDGSTLRIGIPITRLLMSFLHNSITLFKWYIRATSVTQRRRSLTLSLSPMPHRYITSGTNVCRSNPSPTITDHDLSLSDRAMIAKPPDSVIRLHVGSSRSVHCDATGSPTPTVKWIRGSSHTPPTTSGNGATLELVYVTGEDAGTYYCFASNTLVNPPRGRREEVSVWTITVVIEGEFRVISVFELKHV